VAQKISNAVLQQKPELHRVDSHRQKGRRYLMGHLLDYIRKPPEKRKNQGEIPELGKLLPLK